MEISKEEYLIHYGILRKSGRYPWGSGATQAERNRTFLSTVEDLRVNHRMSDTEIARGFGMTTTQLRASRSIAKNAETQANIAMAQRLKDKGNSNVAIGRRMGLNESSVRALLDPGKKDKADILDATSNMLKDQVAEKGYIDVGSGVEHHVGVSRTKLNDAIAKLDEEGYTIHYVKVEQLGTGQHTTVKVLAAPDTPYSEVFRNRDQIKQIQNFSEDGGRSYLGIQTPISVNSKRVSVRYAEQGGADADGVIYIRPGVNDISIGAARYAQVRIAVDETHYLKGMAVYKEGLPEGVDLQFNTNKKDTGNKLDAMKKVSGDPDNPFGAIVRQITDPKTGKLTSAMNIVGGKEGMGEEGGWETWSKSLSSQFLSKQSPSLARAQLDMALQRKQSELDGIRNLDNPSVKQKLLELYADEADSSSVHLKAAALPRQGSHVILPVNSMKPTEVYAPNFRDGERVALIRYPHGGIFEIPELTVNNRNPEAKKLLGGAKDAIGIHSDVAQRLSGADFDGDTVLVIPNNNRKIKTEPALEGLKGFDPQSEYPGYEGMTKMSARTKAFQMGDISNLITDMTIRGATNSEKARAVRHSMVVIDAEKHGLNWKQSAIDNGISHLKEKYQSTPGSRSRGASTIISRASAEVRVPDRKARPASEGGPIDKATGKKVYELTGETYEQNGKTIVRTIKSKKLAETDNAHTLSSGTPIEAIYADHSNALKNLANIARKEASETKTIPYSPEAKREHLAQAQTLQAKLNLALRNSPLERQAQVIANSVVTQKKNANPDMEPSEIKKLKAQALTEARNRTGAKKTRIEITDEEWAAIQAGAISTHRLHQILNNADLDKVKQLATPKSKNLMSDSKKNQAVAMLRNGYTQAEVADHLGVSVTTLKRSLSEGDA